MSSIRRLHQLQAALSPASPESIGQLKLGDITYDVPESLHAARLPRISASEGHQSVPPLSVHDTMTLDNLHFMLQKYILGQDVFLISQPGGPYARRLAMAFCRLVNSEYEYIALHRDVSETELKQGREIRQGGNLVYVDSAAVRAVKTGRILIIEGIEKAERGIMPLLNNLLENREMNLDDGTHILHPHRFALLDEDTAQSGSALRKVFVPAHKSFRVIAIAAPVPPYSGYPLDPPFRSRFQARFVDPVGALLSLTRSNSELPLKTRIMDSHASQNLMDKLRELVLSTQYASESRNPIDSVAGPALPAFPQTALAKLERILRCFPVPDGAALNQAELGRFILILNPGLLFAPWRAWAMLSERCEVMGLGPLHAGVAQESAGTGLLGYKVIGIERVDTDTAQITFASPSGHLCHHRVPCGPNPLKPFPEVSSKPTDSGFIATPRVVGLLTAFLQAHALGYDISYVPPATPGSTASCSTSTLVRLFGECLGYERDVVNLWKEVGGRELLMRRIVEDGGATRWEPSSLIDGALKGSLVHLAGLDVIGLTAGSLARLMQDRECELWEDKRVVAHAFEEEVASGELRVAHPSFRVIATASQSVPLRDWLTHEHSNMFFPIPAIPMPHIEESALLLATGCPSHVVDTMMLFAEKYRASMLEGANKEGGGSRGDEAVLKKRRLGTRGLIRMAKWVALLGLGRGVDGRAVPVDGLHEMICRSLLAEFLPPTERMNLDIMLEECGVVKTAPAFNPSPISQEEGLLFPAPSYSAERDRGAQDILIPRFAKEDDPEGARSFVPHMDHFYDNSLQTASMKDLAIEFEVLGEHLVLLGNQGVGKNKIIDRLCQLLKRPREYIQLHRDTTVTQLMFQTSLENGLIKHTDSPLLRAIILGRIIVIDEADKAPEHVVAIFRSLAGQGELSLNDGRRVKRTKEKEGDLVMHKNFRMILLANRPGYPFLGNHFLQVLGDNFSCHSVSNPDLESERRLLSRLAPELDEDLIRRLVGAFDDLRKGYVDGSLTYPYSLRELMAIVRHMRAYPTDTLDHALRNVFDFDVYKPEAIDKLAKILEHHGLQVQHLGLEAAREASKKKVLDLKFEPKGATSLDKPKFGKEDPANKPHTGGNTWAGGTGGRDTAGLGGRGGYMRLFKGHDINQVSDELKKDVSKEAQDQAREMAREELKRRLEELNLTAYEAKGYAALLGPVQAHVAQLHDLLENLAAKEEERVWIKRQTDGELDDSRLTEGLTGEATVYKRRGMAKPELGRPQIKPKRIRFLFDVSGSMYRFQYDGRLQRSLETAVMLMESFDRLSRKDKYVWDIYGHSGDSPDIPLVKMTDSVSEVADRWKVVEKMNLTTQYAFSGDFTVEALEKAVTEVSKFDGDDHFVIAITDANFARYGISAEDLQRVMTRQPKVKTALICIGEGAEVAWIPKRLPGKGFRVDNTADIPNVLRSILSTMVDG